MGRSAVVTTRIQVLCQRVLAQRLLRRLVMFKEIDGEVVEVEVVTVFVGYNEEGIPVFETVERVPEAN